MKVSSAKDVARFRSEKVLWLDHATINKFDINWMKNIERLILWNVKIPNDFLNKIEKLWWLDIRGGSYENLDFIKECNKLKYLRFNQIKKISDITEITNLISLEFISIFGLASVDHLPSFTNLINLKRFEIGQMKRLFELYPAIESPNLEELLLMKKIAITEKDIDHINKHPSIKSFYWFAEDVPDKIWVPVINKIPLPKTKILYAENWFGIERL